MGKSLSRKGISKIGKYPYKVKNRAHTCNEKFFFHHLFLRKYLIEDILIFSPVFMDFHAKCEEYFFIEYFFEKDARFCTDFLYFCSSFSDNDHLLRIRFYIDIGLYRKHRKRLRCISSFLFDLRHFDIGGIGDFITKFEKESLSNNLLNTKIHGLVCIKIWIVEIGSFRKKGSNPLE